MSRGRFLDQDRALPGQQAVEFLWRQTQSGQALIRLEGLLQDGPGTVKWTETGGKKSELYIFEVRRIYA